MALIYGSVLGARYLTFLRSTPQLGLSGAEAFRWTSNGGMVGLGYLNGNGFGSYAHGVSADGSAVVGWSSSVPRQEAFR